MKIDCFEAFFILKLGQNETNVSQNIFFIFFFAPVRKRGTLGFRRKANSSIEQMSQMPLHQCTKILPTQCQNPIKPFSHFGKIPPHQKRYQSLPNKPHRQNARLVCAKHYFVKYLFNQIILAKMKNFCQNAVVPNCHLQKSRKKL